MKTITLSILIAADMETNSINELAEWLGRDCPSKDYQEIGSKFVAEIMNTSQKGFSSFLLIDHSENNQWRNEYSSLTKAGAKRWKLGNKVINKGDEAWLRLGGNWIKVIFEYDKENGYRLVALPEKTYLPISTELKMRWQIP